MIEGRDFLIVVRHLHSEEKEAFIRTSISRAYYAAFLEARSFCEEYLPFIPKKGVGEHRDVPRLLGKLDPSLEVELSYLRTMRNAADYDIHLSSETMARNSIFAEDYADRIIQRLDAMWMANRAADADDAYDPDEDDTPRGPDDTNPLEAVMDFGRRG